MSDTCKSIEILLDMTKEEYYSEIKRFEKLNQKISMLLAFCGVIFIAMLDKLHFIKVFSKDSIIISGDPQIVVWVSFFLQITSCVTFAYALYNVFNLLNAREFPRNNFQYLLEEICLQNQNEKIVSSYLAISYGRLIEVNRKINNLRSKEYNKALKTLGVTLALIALSDIIKYNLLIIR